MKYNKKPKIRVVSAQYAEDFEQRVNDIVDELSKQGITPRLEFPQGSIFTAYITYEERQEIPETCEDLFELRGIRYKCENCPHYIPSEDKRVKYTHCQFSPFRVGADSGACEFFYKSVVQGQIKPKETA